MNNEENDLCGHHFSPTTVKNGHYCHFTAYILASPRIWGKYSYEPLLPHTMPLKIGQPLPEISLKQKTDAGLADVSLRRNVGKGKTVILFFPLAFTSFCTDELCKVTGLLDEYKKLGADVIAISVDSPFAQEAWAKQSSISVTLVSDFNRVALKAFKVKDTRVIPEKTGLLNVAKRSVFVADKAGNVIHSEVKRDPSSMPNFAKIKKAVEA